MSGIHSGDFQSETTHTKRSAYLLKHTAWNIKVSWKRSFTWQRTKALMRKFAFIGATKKTECCTHEAYSLYRFIWVHCAYICAVIHKTICNRYFTWQRKWPSRINYYYFRLHPVINVYIRFVQYTVLYAHCVCSMRQWFSSAQFTRCLISFRWKIAYITSLHNTTAHSIHK